MLLPNFSDAVEVFYDAEKVRCAENILRAELKRVKKDPLSYCKCEPAGDDIFEFIVRNIDKFGNIKLDRQSCNWTPAVSIEKMLLSICAFLDDPNADIPFNSIATMYRNNRELYNRTAKAWTERYAMGNSLPFQQHTL
ncbi:hypothetical protein GIB67_028636 [Kingdonia uniflora]|uniref:UBC core domain-containing protein n=1 Tax=Kingdonia uniflora TaxID=39325 RepID=A0A7J7KZG9_9MAGN|nr:hypothetical protein GIB67_028636 [Kingdonia uniflora]